MMKVLVFVITAVTVPHSAAGESSVVNEDIVDASRSALAGPDVNNEDSMVAMQATRVTQEASRPRVSKRAKKSINMVINTLADILQSIKNEEIAEGKIYNEHKTWCESQKRNVGEELRNSRSQLENAKVLSEEQISSIEHLSAVLKKNSKELQELDDSVEQASVLRRDENEKYTEEVLFNTQSQRQIDRAIEHVGKVQKQGGFLQGGVVRKLQLNQPGESSYVLGVMKGLKDRLVQTAGLLKKTEKDKVIMFNDFMETKGKLRKVLTDDSVSKKILLTETEAKLSGVKVRIGKLTEEIEQLVKYLSELEESCLATEKEWKLRQEDRVHEKASLNAAMRFLKETALYEVSSQQPMLDARKESDTEAVAIVPSFVQVESSSQEADESSDEAEDEDLMRMGQGIDSHMQKDTFNGVKAVVQKLISSHVDTQQEEKSKREFCQKEIESTEDEKVETTDSLAAVKANLDKKKSETDMLKDEVKKLYASIDKIRKGVEDAHKIRKKEKAAYLASSKDRGLAIKVLDQAKIVLHKFYERSKSNLLQGLPTPPPKWNSGSPRKTTAAFGVVSMIQKIADDIFKEQEDAKEQETKAALAFEKLQQESQTDTDNKHQDITERVKLQAKLGVQINTEKQSWTEKNDELTAINSKLTSLHRQCDELLKFYDQRRKARDFEISQLRDVTDVLSGSSIAPRTGLVDETDADADEAVEDSAQQKEEEALMKSLAVQ